MAKHRSRTSLSVSGKEWRLALFLVGLAAACSRDKSPDLDLPTKTLNPGMQVELDLAHCARDVTPDWPESWKLERVNPAEDCVEYLPITRKQRGMIHLSLCPFAEPLKAKKGWNSRMVELGDRTIQCSIRDRGQMIDLKCRVEFDADRLTPLLWAEWSGRERTIANELLRFVGQVPLGPADCGGNGAWICGLCPTGDKMFLKSREDVQNDVLLGG
jgi:hypothetical protein